MNVWAKCTVLICNAVSTYSKHSAVEMLQKTGISKEICGPNRHIIVLTSMGNDLSQFSQINIRITGPSTDGAWPIIQIQKALQVLFISYCQSARVNAPNAVMSLWQTVEWSRTVPGNRIGLFCFVDINACNNISSLKRNGYAELL